MVSRLWDTDVAILALQLLALNEVVVTWRVAGFRAVVAATLGLQSLLVAYQSVTSADLECHSRSSSAGSPQDMLKFSRLLVEVLPMRS